MENYSKNLENVVKSSYLTAFAEYRKSKEKIS